MLSRAVRSTAGCLAAVTAKQHLATLPYPKRQWVNNPPNTSPVAILVGGPTFATVEQSDYTLGDSVRPAILEEFGKGNAATTAESVGVIDSDPEPSAMTDVSDCRKGRGSY